MSDDSTDPTESAGADSRGDAASNEEIDQLISEYKQQGRRCAKITVVRREPPVSANVGDQAVVTENKELTGWIGGADCAQSIAIEKAVEAIEKGEPLLIGLAPDPDDVDRPGLEAHPMTCHSGGTLELFIEPITTSAHIVVIGDSPVAEALVEIAENMDTQTTSVKAPNKELANDPSTERNVFISVDDPDLPDKINGASAIIIASMGEYDELALEAALRTNVPYVGLVTSVPRRNELATTVADHLGTDPDTVINAISAPAGIDIGAESPSEIAVSIIAELIAHQQHVTGSIEIEPGDANIITPNIDTYPAMEKDIGESRDNRDQSEKIDPVCGMQIATSEAMTVDYNTTTYYFCSEGCAQAFKEQPANYIDEVGKYD